MTRILFVRAGDANCLFKDFLRIGCVAVGWPKLGDLSNVKSRIQMEAELLKNYHKCVLKNGKPKNGQFEIENIAFRAQPGDLIATLDGKHNHLYIGEISGTYKYVDSSTFEAGGEIYRHTLSVKWKYYIERSKSGKYSFKETGSKYRNRVAFWLDQETTIPEILSAPRHNIL